jgi:hypothetical protein
MIIFILCLVVHPIKENGSQKYETNESSDSLKPQEKWFTIDKLHHFSYSLGISGLFYHIYHCQFNNPNPKARYLSISVTGIIGISKELYDKYIRKTKFSYRDLIANGMGILASTLLFMR